MVDIANTSSPAKDGKDGARAARVTLTRVQAREVPAHGGRLIDRLVRADEAADLLLRARELPRARLDARAAADAELVATGVYSPLDGFLGRDDYLSVIRDARLAGGEPFPLPVTLGVPRAEAGRFAEGREAALEDPSGRVVGVLAVADKYELGPDEVALGGRLTLALRAEPAFPGVPRDPREVRALLAARGWRRAAALPMCGPVDAGHGHLLRGALEHADGVAVLAVVGDAPGDEARMRSYEVLLQALPRERALLAVLPRAARDAGPREALLLRIACQNHGFSHVIGGA